LRPSGGRGRRVRDLPLPAVVRRRRALGLSIAAGTLVKLQPALLFGWMAVTRRWWALAVGLAACAAAAVLATLVTGLATWGDYVELLGRVSQPVMTPKNMTPGAVAYRAGLSVDAATAVHYASMAATAGVTLFAYLRRDAATGFVVGVVASQLLSPLLWDHYAMLLLIPVALLLEPAAVVGGGDPPGAMDPCGDALPAGVRARPGGPNPHLRPPSPMVICGVRPCRCAIATSQCRRPSPAGRSR
jgi:hypothetical protein